MYGNAKGLRELPGGLMIRTQCFYCGSSSSIPGWGAEILQARRCSKKNKREREKEREKEKKKYAEEKIKKSKIFEKEFLGCLAILALIHCKAIINKILLKWYREKQIDNWNN